MRHGHRARWCVDHKKTRNLLNSVDVTLTLAVLSGLGEVSVLQGYGPVLRKHRKLLVQALHPRIVRRDFVPLQERIARKLMKAILQDPGRFFDQVQLYVVIIGYQSANALRGLITRVS